MAFLSTISDFLVILLGAFFLIIAFMNLFGSCAFMGRIGAKFVYEMDAIMGGLLGISNFSKYEGALMLVASIGCLQIFCPNPRKQLWIVLGLMLGGVYLLLCVVYAMFARQPLVPFIVFTAVVWLVGIWRILAELQSGQCGVVGWTFVIAMVVAAVGAWRMKQRAESQDHLIQRFIRIQRYCDENPQFVWVAGEDAPIGFES